MSNGKPDFSNVTGGASSTEAAAPAKPDFSNVSGGVQSTEQVNEGGGGGDWGFGGHDTTSTVVILDSARGMPSRAG